MTDIPIGLAGVMCTGLATIAVAIIKFGPKGNGNTSSRACQYHLPLVERVGKVENNGEHTAEAVRMLTEEVRGGFRRLHDRLDEMGK